MKKLTLIAVAALALTSCATAPKPLASSFEENIFSGYDRTGNSTVKGQGFLTTRGGFVKYAAGRMVFLMPANGYTFEIMQRAQQGGRVTNLDPRIGKYVRRTQADGSGNFQFNNVPAGNYYAGTDVTWSNGNFEEGGAIFTQVHVEPNQTVQAIITQ